MLKTANRMVKFIQDIFDEQSVRDDNGVLVGSNEDNKEITQKMMSNAW